jgi:hypothetical protein
MGLVKQLVLLPLAPVRGVMWLTERIAEAAELELDDPERIKARMGEAQLAYERGEIDEQELAAEEEVLLAALNRLVAGGGGEEVGRG